MRKSRDGGRATRESIKKKKYYTERSIIYFSRSDRFRIVVVSRVHRL